MYVPDEVALGNPGVFGFLKKAVSTVGKVLTGQQTVKLPQPQIIVQSPAPQVSVPGVKFDFSNPLVIGGIVLLGALVVVPMLTRRN